MIKLITLCMIVKDEEAVLDRCLKSIHNWVDEIIIVDTGSTDSTKTIARKYTDKVFDFQWINDFSAARNEALKHATGKWILTLDADEYMEEKDIRGLHEFLRDEQPKDSILYCVPVISFLGSKKSLITNESSVVRLFANHMGIHYIRPIHEQAVSTKGLAMNSVQLPFRIFHSGYVEETLVAKNKHERNLSIFKQMKKQSEFTSYDHLMLGNQYSMMGKYDEAMNHLQIALKDGRNLGNTYKQVLFSMLQVYLNTGKFIDAWNFSEQYLTHYMQYPDIQSIRGIILLYLGFTDMAKQTFLHATEETEQRARSNKSMYIVSPDLSVTVPLKYLAGLYEQEKNFPKAVYFLTKILIANNRDIEALTKLVEILSLQEESNTIVSFIDKLLTIDKALIPTLMCKISISLGNSDLAQHYYKQQLSEHALKPAFLLRYALITNNLNVFERILKENLLDAQLQPATVQQLILGSVTWEKYEWLDWYGLTEEHEGYAYLQWTKNLFAKQPYEITDSDQSFAFDLLSGLYSVNQFAAFDYVLESVNSASLINKMANFFYAKHQHESAFQYYSHLIEHHLLDADSCANLANYHISQQRYDDALPFLEKAISLQPKRKSQYIQYCNICSDPTKKARMKQHLLELDSQFNNLPIFTEL